MKVYEYEETKISLGENAVENTELVKCSNPNFTWVHLKSFPSGHVVIESSNPSRDLLQYASSLCLQNTKQKKMKNVMASITNISNLKLTDKKGEVEFISNRKVLSFRIFN